MSGVRPEGWLDPFASAGWPAGVRGCVTTRAGAPAPGFDLGGCAPAAEIAARRAGLAARLGVERVRFLRQVHGTEVVELDRGRPADELPEADGAVTRRPGEALAILTADCLPVLFADREGRCVAAAHAGWRGLGAGVLEATVATMACPPDTVLAWLGPAIGVGAFEVGPEVRETMLAGTGTAAATTELERALHRGRGDRWHLDLVALAAVRLRALGVGGVSASGIDSFADPARFYSHRRDDGRSGRHAALIWLSPRRRS